MYCEYVGMYVKIKDGFFKYIYHKTLKEYLVLHNLL